MRRRIAAALLANAFALATVAGAALADSNCTGPKAERPASCHESGQAGPGNFISDGAEHSRRTTEH